jgi:serine/threonine-protein kinase
MALTIGTRVGPYEIVAPLGAGGMGEVYKAHDTELYRDIALKALPELFATDPDRLARFKREAQVLASLNHPNIAAIYGIEESNSTRALALEFVEGPTLADRIAKGPIPLDEALPIARQIAEALEAAHEQGVIHRDLKPANIKVRPDGTVKVLDFGLAKAFEGDVAMPDVSQSPTLSMGATYAGAILGTAAYMAPEQARGKKVDKRADIWAFGCVLFEMLTGQQAFEGEDVSEILASVIKGNAKLELLPSDLPRRLRQIISRCLEKNVRNRLRDVGDIRIELDHIPSEPLADIEITGEAVRKLSSFAPWRSVAAVLVTALVTGFVGWTLKPDLDQPHSVSRFVHALPAGQTLRNTGRAAVAISPNGRHFLYNTPDGLFLREIGSLDARLIPGTEPNLTNPFFSPDGQWVGYFTTPGFELQKIPITGGNPVTLCKATDSPFGASWSVDDSIVFGQPEGIVRVSANGGTPEVIVAEEAGKKFDGPQMLPGGEWILFSSTSGTQLNRWNDADVVAQSLETGDRKVLWKGGSAATYIPTGHLIYAVDDGLFTLPFDRGSVQVTGGPVSILTGLQRAPATAFGTSTAHFAVSDTGTLVYVVPAAGENRTLAWVNRNGQEQAISAPPRAYLYPRLSPDETRVALDVRAQENDIWVWTLPQGPLTRLTFDPGLDRYPVWTPDGRRIVFASPRSGGIANLFWQVADGSTAAERLTESRYTQFPSSVSNDGTRLFFEEQHPGIDVQVLELDAQRRATTLISTTYSERNAEISPDGRLIAYQSNESSDQNEVYVRPFPGVNEGRWQVSSGGGTQPLWRRDGKELYFVDPERRIVAVPIQQGHTFVAGRPEVIADGSRVINPPSIVGRMYDVSHDGQRFLIVKDPSAGQNQEIVVVQDWFEEVRRLTASARK